MEGASFGFLHSLGARQNGTTLMGYLKYWAFDEPLAVHIFSKLDPWEQNPCAYEESQGTVKEHNFSGKFKGTHQCYKYGYVCN